MRYAAANQFIFCSSRSSHKKPKEDTFGQNDEDWMVYRSIVSMFSILYIEITASLIHRDY